MKIAGGTPGKYYRRRTQFIVNALRRDASSAAPEPQLPRDGKLFTLYFNGRYCGRSSKFSRGKCSFYRGYDTAAVRRQTMIRYYLYIRFFNKTLKFVSNRPPRRILKTAPRIYFSRLFFAPAATYTCKSIRSNKRMRIFVFHLAQSV